MADKEYYVRRNRNGTQTIVREDTLMRWTREAREHSLARPAVSQVKRARRKLANRLKNRAKKREKASGKEVD